MEGIEGLKEKLESGVEGVRSSAKKDLNAKYSKSLESAVKIHKMKNNGSVSKQDLDKMGADINKKLLGMGFRLEDIKEAQKLASSKIKTSTDTSKNTETKTENTDTTAKQQTEENLYKDKEKEYV